MLLFYDRCIVDLIGFNVSGWYEHTEVVEDYKKNAGQNREKLNSRTNVNIL